MYVYMYVCMYVGMFVCMYVHKLKSSAANDISIISIPIKNRYLGIAAIEIRHVFCLLCLLTVFAHISIVGTVVYVFESVEMLEKLKRLRKEALDTGKIKFRKETGIDFDHDGVIQLEGTLEQKIKELNRRLEVLNRIELN